MKITRGNLSSRRRPLRAATPVTARIQGPTLLAHRRAAWPLLLLAAALVALAVFVAPGAQPAQATHGSAGHLTGLTITGTVTRAGETVTFDLWPNPLFDANTASYTIAVPSDLESITFTPTWTDTAITGVTLLERTGSGSDTTGAATKGTANTSGAALTNSSGPLYPTLRLTTTGSPSTRMNHHFNLEFTSVSFGSATVDDMAFTAGAEVPNFSSRQYDGRDVLKLALPAATAFSHNVTYTASGLPTGLSMGQDRIIRGTPTATTDSPATVTYTAADESGEPASLSFQVTVNPPVAFAEDDLETFFGRIITFTAGQAQPLTVTLPEAAGGTGTLTYELLFNSNPDTVTSDVPGAGVSLDPSTRVLTIDGNSSVNRMALKDVGYAVTYRAKDENGATASADTSISVVGPPTLPEITDKTYTAGAAVSLTLPAATGTWWNMVPALSYRLEPVITVELMNDGAVSRTVEILDMEGMSFNTVSRLLSGTPEFAGSTEMTYTATDGNGVSATKTFTINVVNGPNVPTSAPASLEAGQASSNGTSAATWGSVTGATAYVVQIIADGGSYPDKPVNSAPDGVVLSFRTSQVIIVAIGAGDYKVRVAARNDDGVGPWSAEVSFTVRVGGV